MPSSAKSYYFTEFTIAKGIFYLCILIYVVLVCIAVAMEPFMTHACYVEHTVDFENPSYNENPCRHMRLPKLMFLTPDECSFGRRLVMSVLMGGVIGWERRNADRPAGIRTMSLVSLGSCLFTINSAFAFLDGPMAWDASRISAAIPSGVGFLGAGLIFKQQEKDKLTGESNHVVHGLTTAASLWLSAAVGVACGGELYFAAWFGICLTLVLLRFGPRLQSTDDEEDEESAVPDMEVGYYASTKTVASQEDKVESEKEALFARKKHSERSKTVRKRPQLGGMV